MSVQHEEVHLSAVFVEEDRPRQAVILAGGRGKRLAPITDHLPKPMVPIHGRPFLEYLITLLKDQGFERILLLLGYLPNVIQEHFGDGRRWDVRVEYSVTDVDDETGRRLALVRHRLDDIFLLLYCDNYWPMRFDDLWGTFRVSGVPALVTVYSNRDGYTSSNLAVDPSGFVSRYDRTRKEIGLQGVDIGFMLLRREILDLLPEGNPSFEETVLPRLIARRALRAYVTQHRYYSIGSYERLRITESFLERRPTVIIDRDGVLNRKKPRAQYVRSWREWEWLPGALDGLRSLREAGFRVIVVTNQPGVARGAVEVRDLDTIHARMQADALEHGGRIDAVYCCTHDWDEGCECRKPAPGMLFQAQRDFHLDLTWTPFVGDDERDWQAARAAGCPWVAVDADRGLREALPFLLSREH